MKNSSWMKWVRNLTFDQFMECNWQLASGFESTSSVFIFLNHILKHKTLANTDLFATMTLSLKVSQRVYFWNLYFVQLGVFVTLWQFFVLYLLELTKPLFGNPTANR